MYNKYLLEQRIIQHPEDKYLMFLYKWKIISIKTTHGNYNFNYMWINCYFNKKNPLSWIYVFLKSLRHGLKGFGKMFKMKWSRILNSHSVSKGVEV